MSCVRAVLPTIYPSESGAPLPKRIIFVSAHWESESSGFEIAQSAELELIFNYYGLPDAAYLQHVAPDAKLVHPSPDHFTPFVIAGMDENQSHGVKIIDD